ncbi:hypothetical protein [Phenylobacterium montanum]|uniref:Uncharacterized protein n=1 Tax=Phenylobacterium montanum TaxID=2823693 RepID=A0A975G1K7_9CAUL|nr:hypothetical protein [Caulobacter sp. S6]QUD89200.1 hypothetical protein KCG34_04780 [Caulobacter sp. S6]
MKRAVFSALGASVAAAALLAAGGAWASGLGGSLQGRVTQNDTSETYPMAMTLDGAGGRISYPSVSCDGDLSFLGSDGTTWRYKEHITKGDCIDGGIIQMRRRTAGDDTAWVWRWDAEDVNVQGVVKGTGVAER